ncbi:MAG: RICIN domain-containing protein [Myxococcales bacterium]|nr:RICIN domain-containing protein [Myxococcales bacterium]
MGIFDKVEQVGSGIVNQIAHQAESVVDGGSAVATDAWKGVRRVEDLGLVVGQGVIGAAGVVSSGFVTFVNDAKALSLTAAGEIVVLGKTSGTEIAEWSRTAAGTAARFSTDAFTTVGEGLAQGWGWLSPFLSEDLPSLAAPSSVAREIAMILLPGAFLGFEEMARQGNLTIEIGLKAKVSAFASASGQVGIYVGPKAAGQESQWGFYYGWSISPLSIMELFSGGTPKFTLEFELSILHGKPTSLSGLQVVKLGVKAKLGAFLVEGAALMRTGWPPVPIGARLGAGATLDLFKSNTEKSDKPDAPAKPPQWKIRPDASPNASPLTSGAYELLASTKGALSGLMLANTAHLQPTRKERARATGQVAAIVEKMFAPLAYCELVVRKTTQWTETFRLCTETDGSAWVKSGSAVPRALFRLVAGLADPTKFSIESVEDPPRYLYEHPTQGVRFAPYSIDNGFRQAATFDLDALGPDGSQSLCISTSYGGKRYLQMDETMMLLPTVGFLALASSPDRAAWSIEARPVPEEQGSTLLPLQLLRPGEYRRSPNGLYCLTLRADGALGVFRGSSPKYLREEVWATSAFPGPVFAQLCADGRLRVFQGSDPDDNGAALWSTGLLGQAGQCFAALTNTGALAVFQGTPDQPGDLVWSSSHGAQPFTWASSRVALIAANGKFVGSNVWPSNPYLQDLLGPGAVSDRLGENEALKLLELSTGHVALRSSRMETIGLHSLFPEFLGTDVGLRTEHLLSLVRNTDGTVSFQTQTGKFLGIIGTDGSLAASATTRTENTKFRIVTLANDPISNSDQVFTIQAVHSGKLLDIEGGSYARGRGIVTNTASGSATQRWRISHLGDGYFHIVNFASGQSIDIAGSSTDDAANVLQWPGHASSNQIFSFRPCEDGSYLIIAKHSGKVLDVAGSEQADGARVIQYARHETPNQRFRLALASSEDRNVVPLSVLAHISNVGDRTETAQTWVGVAGNPIQAMRLSLPAQEPWLQDLRLSYMGHVQSVGDTGWVEGGNHVGKPISGLRLEGFAIKLEISPTASPLARQLLQELDICYQARIVGQGMTDICRNGEFCGTRGQSLALDGLRVFINRRLPPSSASAEAVSGPGAAYEWQLVGADGEPGLYRIENGRKRWIVNPDTYFRLGYQWGQHRVLSGELFERIPYGANLVYPGSCGYEGQLIKADTRPNVYRVEGGRRRWIVDEATFLGLGYEWSQIRVLPQQELDLIPFGENLTL